MKSLARFLARFVPLACRRSQVGEQLSAYCGFLRKHVHTVQTVDVLFRGALVDHSADFSAPGEPAYTA